MEKSKTPAPTIQELACLRQARDAGGELEIGGVDGRKVRASVWRACVQYGWLSVNHWPEPYSPWLALRLTEAGEAILNTLPSDR